MAFIALTMIAASVAPAQNTAVFPGRVATNSDLFIASNNYSANLTLGINATATTITVPSTSGFTAPGLVSLDSEIIAVCAVASGTTFTVGHSACPNVDGRGYDGTVAASHIATRPVQGRIVAWPINQHSAELKAVETKVRDESVSVKDKGAKCDGSTDDSAAFQAAVDAGTGNVVINDSAAGCVIKTTLNLTNLRGGLTLHGASHLSDGSRLTARIIAETGSAPAIDESGSFGVNLEDFKIEAGATTPSSIGILQARTNSNLAQYNHIRRVYIHLPYDGTANSNQGTVAIYNYGSEIETYDSLITQADNGIVLTASNLFNLASPFQTVYSGATSMSMITLVGANSIYGGNVGPALTLDGVSTVSSSNDTYFSVDPVHITYTYAVNGRGNNYAVNLRGHIEGYPQVLYLTGGMVASSLDLNFSNQNLSAIELYGVSALIKQSEIRLFPNAATFHSLVHDSGSHSATNVFSNNIVWMALGQNLSYSQLFYGNLLLGENSNPTFSVPAGSVYIQSKTDGTHIGGDLYSDSARIILSNAKALSALDTMGTIIPLIELAADNTVSLCSIGTPATNGDCIFFIKGAEAGRFAANKQFQVKAGIGMNNTALTGVGSGSAVPVYKSVPANASSACTTNDLAVSSTFAYFCVATNTWVRVALATW